MRHRSGLIAMLVVLLVLLALAYLWTYRRGQVSADLAAMQQKSAVLQQRSQDLGTTSKAKMAIELNKNISRFSIDIHTDNGVVTLSGKVPRDSDKSLIAQVVQDTPGVKEVVNNIVVEPTPEALAQAEKERVADLEIKSAVLESFLKNADLRQDSQHINVDVANRVVKLTGTVSSAETKNKATDLARGVSGVRAVNNDGLTVSGINPLRYSDLVKPGPS